LAPFKFLASVTSRVPKMTIPSPSMLRDRGGRKAIDASALGETLQQASQIASSLRSSQ
jgi:hypothetical protein